VGRKLGIGSRDDLGMFLLFFYFLFKKIYQNNGGGVIYLSSANLYTGEERVEVERLGRINRKVFLYIFLLYINYYRNL
jgi:hypothetical protein